MTIATIERPMPWISRNIEGEFPKPIADAIVEDYTTMTAKTTCPKDTAVTELLDILSLSQDERLAFYGSLFAIAATDGALKRDELDLIFETIEMTGLSDHVQRTIWDYMIDPPSLSDCLDLLSSRSAEVRCAVMVYLIEIALVDDILDVREEEALLQARRALHLTQPQIHAIERFICEEGLIRPRASDYKEAGVSLKHGASVLTALSIPATAVYFSGLPGGLMMSEPVSDVSAYASAVGAMLAVGAAVCIGAVSYVAGRLLGRRKQRRAALAHERRRRAQLACRNLQHAVGYLSAKAIGDPVKPAARHQEIPAVFAERLSVLQQMLAQRQSTADALS
jgi:VIT1/CCC1 family predicted Fe2+/Mn2+ transporter